MNDLSLALATIGAATVTSWLFRLLDAIEAPSERRSPREL